MEITHPYLRMAAGALLAAGLASACSGGSSGTAATPPVDPVDPEPPAPAETRMPEDCTDASPTCTVTSGTTTTVTTNVPDADAMENTRTVTVSGTMRTITVTDTTEGRNNRIKSIEVQACTGGENCMQRTREERDYGADGDRTTTRHYEMGRLMRRVSGGDTTTIAYPGSMGGRIETTMKSAGTLVERFDMYSGGDATSSVFTSTDGRTVTTALAGGMRREIVYADGARTTRVTMTVGMSAADADTGFAPGQVTRTTYDPSAVGRAGVNLPVEWTETVTLVAMGMPTAVLTSRTYVTERDAMNRETERVTRAVSGGTDGAVTRMVETVYPAADDAMMRTLVVTTSELSGGSVDRATVATTVASGAVTTIVYAGMAGTGQVVTTEVRNPAASDGSVTVATTYGPGAGAGDPADGTRVSVRTLSNGNVETTTSTPGASDDDPRVVSSVVTTDELGVEIMRVTPSAGGSAETRVATAYGRDGGSTVTTTTWTRAADAEADAPLTQSGVTVVVTRDAMQRETLSVTTDSDGMETDRRVTVYAADGSSTATRTFSGGMGDMLMDVNIVQRNAMGDPTDDIVIHPRVQSHGMVNDAQYDMIQEGMAMRTGARTVMSPALLHLNYSGDTAFNGFADASEQSALSSVGLDVEMELITAPPTCSGSSCTYNHLPHAVEPIRVPEVRFFNANTKAYLGPGSAPTIGNVDGWSGQGIPNGGLFWLSTGGGGEGWDNNVGNNQGPMGRAVLFQLLTDLLSVGGAGVTAEFMDPPDVTADPKGPDGMFGTSDDVVEQVRATLTVGRATATELERGTFTDLKTTGLPEDVLGIGRQVKEVDSYLRLGGSRDANDPMNDAAVPVKVENYFGWMANSMFTVRRVTASGVARYDWLAGTPAPGASDEIRAYLAMASGNPSGRPTERTAEGMTDPGTWTGSMIGVGSIQGERYRGRAKVSVDFDSNGVTTAFDQIRLATDFDADLAEENLLRIRHVHDELRDGISFQSAGITSGGRFTSSMLMGGAFTQDAARTNAEVPVARVSRLDGQFYGDAAAEVAGTFTAYHLALGKEGQEAADGYRGDLVGAFGAARDDMTEVEDN